MATILISDKMDFENKAIGRDTGGHYIIKRETIQQDIMLVSITQQHITHTHEASQFFKEK